MDKTAFDMWYVKRQPFTFQEKLDSMKIINTIEEIAKGVRRNGLLSKEVVNKIKNCEDPLLKKWMQLEIDSYDPETIGDLITDYIVASDYKGSRLLQSYLIFVGVQGIIYGENPTYLRRRLIVYLGEDYFMVEKKLEAKK